MDNTVVNFGLSTRDIQAIQNIFSRYPVIETVHIFGSRATDNFKPGSDIDLAIMNSVSTRTLLDLINDFEESSLPYKIDLVNFNSLTNPALKEQIRKAGIVFYSRNSASPEQHG